MVASSSAVSTSIAVEVWPSKYARITSVAAERTIVRLMVDHHRDESDVDLAHVHGQIGFNVRADHGLTHAVPAAGSAA